MSEDKEFKLGQRLTREEIADAWGGSKYSGIEPSTKTDNILLFSDPTKNSGFGYHDDLFQFDDGPLALYVGQGTSGDQELTKRNRSLLEHRQNGKALRLFIADGKIPGTDTGLHRYLGEYELDPVRPCFPDRAPDKDGVDRRVYVFRLRPVDQVEPPPFDHGPVVSGVSYLVEHEDTEESLSDQPLSELIDIEKHSGEVIIRKAIEEVAVRTVERELVLRFKAWLKAKGVEVKRNKIPVPEGTRLYTDLYEVDSKVLYEAKGKSDRNSVRMAIGQLFDYRRSVDSESVLSILLPEAPDSDLGELIKSVGISLVYEENGEFIGWPVTGS
ncbi:hypothetical protein SAMN05216298_1161 [Glycomyces sambucus]|uniref:ScoMcrA-like SRA domain-containing protein n=1 Tax=Glycomyces sambucus TaxID=380244 RepID=A0A1G9DX83_9ACTN|nr:hypothetical protein [Glycomyces sambucus]SDK68476.1 hypothetical protein SAMN05216298_1161 [Glycomyces sambucus]